VGKASGDGKYCKGLKMTNLVKHVALLKNKIDFADVYCVTLIGLLAHRDAFIQKIIICYSSYNTATVTNKKQITVQ